MNKTICRKTAGLVVLLYIFAPSSRAQSFETLAYFHGKNGARPFDPLVQGLDGNFYGTAAGVPGKRHLEALAFRLTQGGSLTTLHRLPLYNLGGLVQSTDGSLYGASGAGDATRGGTFYKIAPDGSLTVLYSFCLAPSTGCPDGATPEATLIQALDGNFYGTTLGYGANGHGTVFRVTQEGMLTTLYNFCSQPNCSDGFYSTSALVQAKDGNFYGTTQFGGNTSAPCTSTSGCGTIFKITPQGVFTNLYSFCSEPDCADSADPASGLIEASDGNLYGTAVGSTTDFGTVFKISPGGAFTTLYRFCAQTGCADGGRPQAGLTQATDGNLYGTTVGGGAHLGGVIFKITLGGELTILHNFGAGPNRKSGSSPYAPLIQATDGKFYGTTTGYRYPNMGTAFRFSAGLRPFVTTLQTSASPGMPVTILGTNLTGATTVKFHNTQVSSFAVNATGTSITTTVPAGATTGPIWVKTPTRTLRSNAAFRIRAD